MDMFSGTKKSGGAGTNSRPGHKKTSSGMGFLLSSAQPHSRVPSRTDDRSPWEAASIASAAPPPLPRPTGAGVAQTPVAVTSPTARQQQRGSQVQPGSNVSPGRLERAAGGGGGESGVDGCRIASKTPAGVAVARGVGHSGGAGGSRPPPQDDVNYPDTPPPLRRMQRRGSLVNREVPPEDDPKEPIEPELMIGEIQVRTHDVVCWSKRFCDASCGANPWYAALFLPSIRPSVDNLYMSYRQQLCMLCSFCRRCRLPSATQLSEIS